MGRRESIDMAEMRPGDLPQVLEIEREAFDDPWQAEHFLHELLENPFSRCFCVRGPGARVDAYACVWIVDRDLLINNIAVRREERRRGLGRRFLQALLEMGRASGCRRVLLDVRPSNRPAVELYRRAGFRITRIRRLYYGGREDGWVMVRDLSGPPGTSDRAVVEGESRR